MYNIKYKLKEYRNNLLDFVMYFKFCDFDLVFFIDFI